MDASSSRSRRRKALCISFPNSIRSAPIGPRPNAGSMPPKDSLMWPRSALLGMLLLAGLVQHAAAAMAYVSNEKSNTVSIIDTAKWEVVKTIKVGQRPRGIAFTRDQKFVLVAVGDDDTIQ